jgi:hypothetical protein
MYSETYRPRFGLVGLVKYLAPGHIQINEPANCHHVKYGKSLTNRIAMVLCCQPIVESSFFARHTGNTGGESCQKALDLCRLDVEFYSLVQRLVSFYVGINGYHTF